VRSARLSRVVSRTRPQHAWLSEIQEVSKPFRAFGSDEGSDPSPPSPPRNPPYSRAFSGLPGLGDRLLLLSVLSTLTGLLTGRRTENRATTRSRYTSGTPARNPIVSAISVVAVTSPDGVTEPILTGGADCGRLASRPPRRYWRGSRRIYGVSNGVAHRPCVWPMTKCRTDVLSEGGSRE
jgi:hypothetical protein